MLKECDRRLDLLKMAKNLLLQVENEAAALESVSPRRSPEVRKKMALVQSKRWKDKKTASATAAPTGKAAATPKAKAKPTLR